MASSVLTLESAKAANISVVENRRYTQTVHDVVVAMQANRRSGTACTKTRGEVRGSNKKLYRQKGTGNARAGERRSPTRVGASYTTFGILSPPLLCQYGWNKFHHWWNSLPHPLWGEFHHWWNLVPDTARVRTSSTTGGTCSGQ